MALPGTVEIALDQAAAGMMLAQALLDANGNVLLPQDAALTDSTLASLRRRGIERCVIRCDVPDIDPEQLARERVRRMERLAHLFRHLSEDEGGAMLLKRLQEYRSKEYA
jgi:hypothetical protein